MDSTKAAIAAGFGLGLLAGAFLTTYRRANAKDVQDLPPKASVQKRTRPLVLVTGGSGLLGSAFKRQASKKFAEVADFHFSSSRECNLLDAAAVRALLRSLQPTHVIHLAADVGGMYKNMKQQFSMFSNNVRMNMNVIEAAHAEGVQHLVACLSTCVFPDEIARTGRPLKEKDLHLGPPHDSNYGYAYAKRMVDVACRALREQHDRNYFCITPTNLYGANDNFNLEDAHVMPALIHKAYLAQQKGEKLMVFGTGSPLRQFLLAEDCAYFTLFCLLEYKGKPLDSVIVSVPEGEEISIAHAANSIASFFGVETYYDKTKPDGQPRKTASNERMVEIYGGPFPYTPFQEALKRTMEWFVENYEKGTVRL